MDLLIDTAKYARAGTVLQWMAEIYEEIQDYKMAGETYAQVFAIGQTPLFFFSFSFFLSPCLSIYDCELSLLSAHLSVSLPPFVFLIIRYTST